MQPLHRFADFWLRRLSPHPTLVAGSRRFVSDILDRAALNLYGESVPLLARCKAIPVILLGIPLGSLTRR